MTNRQWVVAAQGQSLAQLEAEQVSLGNTVVWADADNLRVLVDVPSGASALSASDAFIPKGVIDCSGNPNYPAADAGHVYRVSVAGKIGGASGDAVEVTDRLTCYVDGSAAGTKAQVGVNWHIERDVVSQSYVDSKAIAATSLIKLEQQIVFGDLAAATVVNIGAALPVNAVVLGHEVKLDALFIGGTLSAVKMDVGGTDTKGLVNQFNVHDTAGGAPGLGSWSPGYEHQGSHGTHCNGKYGGQQLVATFTPTGDTLNHATAGDVTITVWYVVLA